MLESLQNTTIPAVFVSHKRGQDVIHPERALLRINNVNCKDAATKYLRNSVLFVHKNKNGEAIYNNGVITRIHGNKGVVQAKFERNLCPKSIGELVYVKLYKLEHNFIN